MLFETYPKWKKISKKEYEKAGKKYAPKTYNLDANCDLTLEQKFDIMSEFLFYDHYKKKPIYRKVKGILAQIKQLKEEKPIGYEYYKYDGSEIVCLVGSEEMEVIKENNLEPVLNPENFAKFANIMNERNKKKK